VKEPIVVNLPIPASGLWLGLLAMAVIFTVASIFISHHWSYYGVSNTNRDFATALYYVGGIALLVGMGLSAAAYGA